jgi:hypothetical protein
MEGFNEQESIRRFFFNINGPRPTNYIVKLNSDGTPSQDCFLLDGTPFLLSSLKTVVVETEGVEETVVKETVVEEGLHLREHNAERP